MMRSLGFMCVSSLSSESNYRVCESKRGSSKRQKDAKCGPLPWLTFDFNSASMRFNYHLAVEHPDADPFLFGGLEWTKKTILNELGRHATSVVRNGEHHPSVLPCRLNSN